MTTASAAGGGCTQCHEGTLQPFVVVGVEKGTFSGTVPSPGTLKHQGVDFIASLKREAVSWTSEHIIGCLALLQQGVPSVQELFGNSIT